MLMQQAHLTVNAAFAGTTLFERYHYGFGAVEPLPKHAHEEYQLCLCFQHYGEYLYRGAWHHIPTHRVGILHSGEPHAPSARRELATSATYWMMYIAPTTLQEVGAQMIEHSVSLPFFPTPVLHDVAIARSYLRLHHAMMNAPTLDQDVLLMEFFAYLLAHHAYPHFRPRPVSFAQPAVARVRDFLHDTLTRNVSLQELADLVDLNPYYLARVFRAQIGIPPHVYHTHLRIAQAKRLLATGAGPAHVASATGFYDQSHLGQHFKRLVGVSPKTYARKLRLRTS